ncbi:MAG: hypothetical protein ACM3NQ_09510 [Bacteroidales bacterium]
MKHLFLALWVVLLVPVLALAQARTPPSGATSSGSAVSRGDAGGGTSSGSPGGGSSGGGTNASGGSASGGNSGGTGIGRGDSYAGSRSFGTGAGGYNAPRGIDRDNGPRSGDTFATPRSSSYSPSSSPRAESRAESRGAIANVGQPVPAQTRPRGDGPTVGAAVPRSNAPKPPNGGGGDGGYYPPYWDGNPGWWYPYYGYGYYWGSCNSWYSYYNCAPYWYYQWFSPWSMYDDWSQMGYAYGGGVYARADMGGIRFKVKPKEAEIWVDGYFEGNVTDYDGGKGLQLKGGMHHIEVKAKGYETIAVDLRAMPGKTVTYTVEMKPLSK